MSWLRIEGRMPNHRKMTALSDAAYRLHVTASCWSVEEQSDGLIPKHVPATLPCAPRGKTLARVLEELTKNGVWDASQDGGFVIESVGDGECRIQTSVRPMGGLTFVIVRYGAACPAG